MARHPCVQEGDGGEEEQGTQPRAEVPAKALRLLVRDISRNLEGRTILIYWPADGQWWPAEVLSVRTRARQATVLYNTGAATHPTPARSQIPRCMLLVLTPACMKSAMRGLMLLLLGPSVCFWGCPAACYGACKLRDRPPGEHQGLPVLWACMRSRLAGPCKTRRGRSHRGLCVRRRGGAAGPPPDRARPARCLAQRAGEGSCGLRLRYLTTCCSLLHHLQQLFSFVGIIGLDTIALGSFQLWPPSAGLCVLEILGGVFKHDMPV